MADISKIKLANGTTVTLKDAQGRADMTTILGGHALDALGAAAWRAVATSISDKNGEIADAATVKAYVDAQIKTIPEFDVVIVAEGEDLPTASANTFHKIYLVKASTSGVAQNIYKEYITVKSGDTYSWELVGDTAIDVSGKVDKTTTIAGIALDKDISVEQLQTALKLGAMAYADTASGSTTLETVDKITMKELTVAGNATVTSADTAAVLTKVNYTPAGTVTGTAIRDGSISVTLKDAEVASEATLSTKTYTPAGTIAAKEGGSFSALKTASFGASEMGVQIEGTVSAPEINLTAEDKTVVTGVTGGSVADFKEGDFTPAAFQQGFVTAGSDASLVGGEYTAQTLGSATKAAFASEGVVAALDADEAECLTFTTAATAQAVTEQGALSEGGVSFPTLEGGKATVIDTTKFSGGSKVKDIFTPNVLQTVSTGAISEVSAAALANAPVFEGAKYAVATTADTALKDVAFTASNSATIVDGVTYVKPVVDTATFNGVTANLGFVGTEVKDALVTGVTYKKAAETAAFSVAVTPETDDIAKTAKEINITVSPDAKAGE